ncbi:MAG: protein translocase subunit SecF [Proteobacteria bacterium]|jgi:preprotein translocase subunit SecF|nr:protein translocase subunit SecF [Pseudomonadota bacterium]
MKQESFGKFDFVGKVGIFGGISLALVVISLVYLAVKGINYGIDFSGGTEVQVKFGTSVTIEQVRGVSEKAGLTAVEIQQFEGNEFVVRFQLPTAKTEKETNELQNQTVQKLKEGITAELGSAAPEYRRVDSVGPQVGAELKRNGFLAVFYSLLVILIYVALRFDYKYSPGAVICLAHDAIITLAIFNLVGKEVNIPILAAILTLIGYSLNDTIVVFDRIRETEGLYREKGYKFIINKAINDMLERTIITAGTTFTSAMCLWIFADGTVSDIAFALAVGIAFGTYSSIYVAAPFILVMEKMKVLKPGAA